MSLQRTVFRFAVLWVIVLAGLAAVELHATEVNGSQSGTWTLGNSPYVVTGSIVVPAGATLTIEPGVEVRFNPGTALDVNGTLDARGTAGSKITFTSGSAYEPGAWTGLRFADGSGGTLSHVRVLYAGFDSPWGGRWSKAALRLDGNASPTVQYSEIAHSAGDGVRLYDTAAPALTNNTFAHLDWPVRLSTWSAMPSGMTGSTFTQVGYHGVRHDSPALPGGAQMSWRVLDGLPYSVGSFGIGPGAVLTVPAGLVVKVDDAAAVDVFGTLLASGAADQPIVFTAAADVLGGITHGDGAGSAAAGAWTGLRFADGSGGTLSHVRVLYAGFDSPSGGRWSRAALRLDGNASPTVQYSEIAHSAGDGVRLYDTAAPALSPNIVFAELSGYAVHNQGTANVDARHNWWGHATGPQHKDNPAGAGFEVTDLVDYAPYLSDRPELWAEAPGPTPPPPPLHSFQGYLDGDNPTGTHTVSIQSHGTMVLRVTTSEDLLLNPGIYLMDNDGETVLYSSNQSPDTTVEHQIYSLNPGAYTLLLHKDSRGWYLGSYHVEVSAVLTLGSEEEQGNNSREAAAPLTLGTPVSGLLGFRGQGIPLDIEDWYQFTLPEHGNLTMRVTTSGGQDGATGIHYTDGQLNLSRVAFFGVDDTTHALYGPRQGPGLDEEHVISALAPGDYLVKLEIDYRTHMYWGSYTLDILPAPFTRDPDPEPNDTFDAAATLYPGRAVTGNLGTRTGTGHQDLSDYWVFEHQGGELLLEVRTSGGEDHEDSGDGNLNLRHPGLQIFDASRSLVWGTTQGPGLTQRYELGDQEAGTYYLHLSKDTRAFYWGTYRVYVEGEYRGPGEPSPPDDGEPEADITVPDDYGTIQAAIDVADAGQTVFVRPAVYEENIRLKSGVTVIGAGAATTIIDGGGSNVVWGADEAHLRGFTLRNGGSAGVFAWSTSPIIEDCVITGSDQGIATAAQPVIRGNTIIGNSQWAIFVGSQTAEGAVSRPVITNNLIIGNVAQGITIFQAGGLVINNTIDANGESGLSLSAPAAPAQVDARIASKNAAENGSGFAPTAAVPVTIDVRNNIITNNGMYGIRGFPFDGEGQTIAYNNVWNNGWDDHSGIEPGGGSLAVDPLYIRPLASLVKPVAAKRAAPSPEDAAVLRNAANQAHRWRPRLERGVAARLAADVPAFDYGLQPGSPCRDAGDPDPIYQDADGTRNDMGAYGGPQPFGRQSPPVTAVTDAAELRPLPPRAALLPNYPNPFNSGTVIPFQLATAGRVRLDVYNLLGQRVRVLLDESVGAGLHQVRWDGRDAAGHAVTSGMYLYRLNVDAGKESRSMTRSMVLLR